jgi:hypothetical protein
MTSIFDDAKERAECVPSNPESLFLIAKIPLLNKEYTNRYIHQESACIPEQIRVQDLLPWVRKYKIFFCTNLLVNQGVFVTLGPSNQLEWIDTNKQIPPLLRKALKDVPINKEHNKEYLSSLYPIGTIVQIRPPYVTPEYVAPGWQLVIWNEIQRKFWIAAFNAKYKCCWSSSFGPFYWLL